MKKLVTKLLWFGGLLLLPQCQSPLKLASSPDAALIEQIEMSGRQIAKNRHLEYLGYGLSDLVDAPSSISKTCGTLWALNLVDRRKLTLEQARREILALYDDFQSLTVGNPSFLKTYDTYCGRCSRDPLFTEERIGIKLAFWDPCNDRPLPPFVAQIKLARGNIRYFFVADGTQRLGDPVIETIAEARAHSEILQ